MTDTEITKYYKPVNGNLLIRQKESSTVMANGMVVTQQYGKKDIVCGTVLLAEPGLKISPKTLAWYPTYSAQSIIIDGTEYKLVNFEDVVLLENVG